VVSSRSADLRAAKRVDRTTKLIELGRVLLEKAEHSRLVHRSFVVEVQRFLLQSVESVEEVELLPVQLTGDACEAGIEEPAYGPRKQAANPV
jgi:hypothetical protein